MYEITTPFHFQQGNSPVLVSMPHSGTALLPNMEQRLTDQAKNLPDTDWYLTELYDFLSELNVGVISANYSRYVVDLNRPVDDKPLYASKTTGLFPEILFSDQAVFLSGEQHSSELKEQIKSDIWQPYHQKIGHELDRIKQQFGYAILFDAHSIAEQVPMLFDGKLPHFNFGNNDGAASASVLLSSIEKVIANTRFSQVSNGRFKGGYITRFFGQPEQDIHAIQLELSQATYLVDSALTDGTSQYQLDVTKTQQLKPILKQLISTLISAGNRQYVR
ncbi:N-formylglutamate deformylase [Vibrio sp. TH_r3]|uniref:N-formylglutamate deformylase n=1 Tax=Vibrio sp. TH_r3 TaxID=3082084 RepID=UPI0029529F21|nr:N-formylglutamate deformylase [Vibrio sp. TH_r3]MDV7105605.1 N-formylglutamate deformylase [Vibrio sp. TH_r3]